MLLCLRFEFDIFRVLIFFFFFLRNKNLHLTLHRVRSAQLFRNEHL